MRRSTGKFSPLLPFSLRHMYKPIYTNVYTCIREQPLCVYEALEILIHFKSKTGAWTKGLLRTIVAYLQVFLA